MRTFLIGVFSVFSVALSAQLTWQYAYGGFSTEEGNSVIATSTGNYLVVGSTGSFGAGDGDIYILMLDPDGAHVWSRTFGGTGVEQGIQVVENADGDFLLVGFTNSFGSGGYDGYLAKFTAAGNLLWESAYGGPSWDFLNSIAVRPDGGSVVAGQTYSAGAGGSDAWVLSLDGDGGVEWEKTFGGPGEDFAKRVINAPGGGFVLAGGLTTQEDQDAWVVRFDATGDTLWTSVQGGDSADHASSIVPTIDGGYAVVGSTGSFSTYTEAYHFKVDGQGALQWQNNWGQVNDQESFDLKELPDGRLISIGYVKSGGSGGLDMFILFTYPNGDFQSGISNGGDNGQDDEAGRSVDLAADGGFVFCGYTRSFGAGPQDVYVVKTDSLGLTESIAVVESFDPLAIPAPPTGSTPILHPNPASTTTHLDRSHEFSTVHLLDGLGRAVRSWTGRVPADLDLRGLNAGLYQVVAISATGTRSGSKLIISAP